MFPDHLSPFIIAEIGINHNGDVEIAKRLIDMAAACGADAVKFQKRDVETVYSKAYLDSPRESPWGTTQREQKLGLELSSADYDQINQHCKERGIPWFASPWDMASVDFLDWYDLPMIKVASAMVTNVGLLSYIAERGKPVLISTGMSTYEEIEGAARIFQKAGCRFTLMHSVSLYPCPEELCNLERIRTLQSMFGRPVGYSGHEVGVLPSIVATVLGAVVIERHITLDRAMYGSDQAASLERRGLELLVRYAKSVARVRGTGKIDPMPGEEEVARKLRYWEAYPDVDQEQED